MVTVVPCADIIKEQHADAVRARDEALYKHQKLNDELERLTIAVEETRKMLMSAGTALDTRKRQLRKLNPDYDEVVADRDNWKRLAEELKDAIDDFIADYKRTS